jgi:metal-responsive CopG/Arc/MetJ family transcriptional regulator
MKKPVTITLEEGLLDEIEEKRGLTPRSRFIECQLLRTFEEEKKQEVAAGYA